MQRPVTTHDITSHWCTSILKLLEVKKSDIIHDCNAIPIFLTEAKTGADVMHDDVMVS